MAEGNSFSVSVVQIFNGSPLSLVTSWSGYGVTLFGNPYGVAVYPTTGTGNVYVLDNLNNAVYEFTSTGAVSNTWGGFNEPEGIAIDGSGNVYVADTGNNQIKEFNQNGAPLNQWSSWTGGSVTTFSSPSAVAFDPGGNIYVADAGNEMVQVFSSPGVYLNQWSTLPGSDIFGLAVTTSGPSTFIYAADAANSQVEEYDSTGNLITEWNGSSGVLFSSPDGVVLSGGNIWVSDFDNGTSGTGSLEEFAP